MQNENTGNNDFAEISHNTTAGANEWTLLGLRYTKDMMITCENK